MIGAMPPAEVSHREWWNRRRIAYTWFAYACAAAGFILFFGVMCLPGMLKPGEDAGEPMGLCVAFVLLPVIANAAISIGMRVAGRLALRRPECDWNARLYRAGLWATGAVFLLPATTGLLAFFLRRL